MAIDVNVENLIGLWQGPASLPRGPSVAKLRRWSEFGIKGRSGEQVFLETIRVGGETCTSVEAFQRFCENASERVIDHGG